VSYAVKELFLTLQGEGMQAGRRAVFLRFSGCNLWSGRERDRAAAQCTFCDTDFVGTDGENGGRYGAEGLARRVRELWAERGQPVDRPRPGPGARPDGALDPRPLRPLVVITGGEPMLQLDAALIDALHAAGFEIAVETNGTLPAPAGLDWICVSPKAGTDVVQRAGDELKLVWPQAGLDPAALLAWDFAHFLIQPLDGPDPAATRAEAIAYVMANPAWRLGLQAHKLLGLP
jgi:7-carboxy-7-deazaguanine synthase (Cx14CxxC type)